MLLNVSSQVRTQPSSRSRQENPRGDKELEVGDSEPQQEATLS